jgi:hypothetical protein
LAPLWLVEYPPGSNVGTLNCEGVPGNCPDHDGLVAAVATGNTPFLGEPTVYGTDPAAVPGHDHLVGVASSHEDFNIAWEVFEVLFTPKAASTNHITHLTTIAAVENAVANGYARTIDLGFAFHCNVVPAAAYNRGTPVG